MKNKFTYLIIAGLFTGLPAVSQDVDVEDPAWNSAGEQKVIEDIAGEFEEFAGENAVLLVDKLRKGEDLNYEVESEVEVEVPVVDADGNPVYKIDAEGNLILDAEGNPIPETTTELQPVVNTVEVDNTLGPQGFGNVKILMLMAQEYLSQQGLDGSLQNMSSALFSVDSELANGISEMRANGAGWGEISQELLGVTVGELQSAHNRPHNRPEKVARGRREGSSRPDLNVANRPSKPDKPEKLSKPEKPEKPEKPAKPDKPDKPDRPFG